MSVLGQRRDRDVGDVLGVNEWLPHVASRERDLAADHEVEQEVSLKFWRTSSSARSSSRRRTPRTACSARWASASPRPASRTSRRTPRSTPAWRTPRPSSGAPGDREVRIVGDVGRAPPSQRGPPGWAVVPVERRLAPREPRRTSAAPRLATARPPVAPSCQCRPGPASARVAYGQVSSRLAPLVC